MYLSMYALSCSRMVINSDKGGRAEADLEGSEFTQEAIDDLLESIGDNLKEALDVSPNHDTFTIVLYKKGTDKYSKEIELNINDLKESRKEMSRYYDYVLWEEEPVVEITSIGTKMDKIVGHFKSLIPEYMWDKAEGETDFDKAFNIANKE